MGALIGHSSGLKTSDRRRLEKLYTRKIARHDWISWATLRELTLLSYELDKQLGLLIHRKGTIEGVVIGERRHIRIPKMATDRSGILRLNQYRFIHTDFYQSKLSKEDITHLLVKRLDCVAAVRVLGEGEPGLIEMAHLSPNPEESQGVVHLGPFRFDDVPSDFMASLIALEQELVRKTSSALRDIRPDNRAIICALRLPGIEGLTQDLEEMTELARTVGLDIVETVIQTRGKPDLKYALGHGRLEEVLQTAIQKEVDYLLFFQNLTPTQAKNIEDVTELKILDRTQLILDIFAQRAQSRDGKLQVELAQLKYMLPRLAERQVNLSRLTGGIGGRGPGETKLEVHRRRAKDKIHFLEQKINEISTHRESKRRLRERNAVPIISIVGYTNAGKSTLLNTLTRAGALAEDKPFATLDPFSKRLKFPREREVVLTDTVGFIRDLPKDLVTAFRATLEEIHAADLLLHVVDISSEHYLERIKAVRSILKDLGDDMIEELLVFNKLDRIDPVEAAEICRVHGAIGLSATQPESCHVLLEALEARLWMS